jgi:hypothetical protein
MKDLVSSSRSGDEGATRYLKMLRHNASIFKAVAEPKDVLELAVQIVKSKVGVRHG